jgi:hypothetical protein
VDQSLISQLVIQGVAAFLGAFFALTFTQIAKLISNIHKRNTKHYDSLVTLETQLNDLGGILNDNIYILPGFRNAITSGYQDLKNALIQKNITREEYMANTSDMGKQLKILETFLVYQQEETIQLMAKVRIKIKQDLPLLIRIQRYIAPVKSVKFTKREVKKEEKKLRKEIDNTRTTSSKQIEEILKRAKVI